MAATEVLIKDMGGSYSHLQLHQWLTGWVCKAGVHLITVPGIFWTFDPQHIYIEGPHCPLPRSDCLHFCGCRVLDLFVHRYLLFVCVCVIDKGRTIKKKQPVKEKFV